MQTTTTKYGVILIPDYPYNQAVVAEIVALNSFVGPQNTILPAAYFEQQAKAKAVLLANTYGIPNPPPSVDVWVKQQTTIVDMAITKRLNLPPVIQEPGPGRAIWGNTNFFREFPNGTGETFAWDTHPDGHPGPFIGETYKNGLPRIIDFDGISGECPAYPNVVTPQEKQKVRALADLLALTGKQRAIRQWAIKPYNAHVPPFDPELVRLDTLYKATLKEYQNLLVALNAKYPEIKAQQAKVLASPAYVKLKHDVSYAINAEYTAFLQGLINNTDLAFGALAKQADFIGLGGSTLTNGRFTGLAEGLSEQLSTKSVLTDIAVIGVAALTLGGGAAAIAGSTGASTSLVTAVGSAGAAGLTGKKLDVAGLGGAAAGDVATATDSPILGDAVSTGSKVAGGGSVGFQDVVTGAKDSGVSGALGVDTNLGGTKMGLFDDLKIGSVLDSVKNVTTGKTDVGTVISQEYSSLVGQAGALTVGQVTEAVQSVVGSTQPAAASAKPTKIFGSPTIAKAAVPAGLGVLVLIGGLILFSGRK